MIIDSKIKGVVWINNSKNSKYSNGIIYATCGKQIKFIHFKETDDLYVNLNKEEDKYDTYVGKAKIFGFKNKLKNKLTSPDFYLTRISIEFIDVGNIEEEI